MTNNAGNRDTKNAMVDKEPGEVVGDAIMGTDREMGEDNASAPAAWVFGTYPIVLLLFAFIAMVAYMFSGAENNAGQTPSTSTSTETKSAAR